MKKTKLYLLVSLFSLTPFAASANSLLDVYELALQNDAQLKADKAKYEAGLENRSIARSNLLPQISANAQISNSDIETTDNLTNTSLKTDTDSKSWEISLSQPLFNMSYWYNYKQGAKLSEQAEAQYGADQQSLIVRTAEAYFNVLRAVETLEATIAEEKALAKQLEQIPEVVNIHYTTGIYSIFAKIICRDTQHLREVLHDKIQRVTGIQRTETFISLEESLIRNTPLF